MKREIAHLKSMQKRDKKISALEADNKALRDALEAIEFKAKRATATHDNNCTCATCDTKRDARALLEG